MFDKKKTQLFEIPRQLIYKRSDGTYGFNQGAVYKNPFIIDDKTLETPKIDIGDYVDAQDNVFGVGGLHSRFVKKGENQDGRLWLYKDDQKLNPQWQIADWVKTKLGINDDAHKDSKLVKFIDRFGGKDLKSMVGFDNNINYRQYLYENKKTGDIFVMPTEKVLPEYR